MNKQSDSTHTSAAQGLLALVQKEIGEGGFLSRDDINAKMGKIIELANKQPQEDFAGLSPLQMDRFLYHTFESPDLVEFPEHTQTMPDAPIITLFGMLADAIGEKGLKTTAKGNLPRKFCREAVEVFDEQEKNWESHRIGAINMEEDFFEMHVTRLVAELAGLLRKYKKRFILSNRCKRLLADDGMKTIYSLLFMTYIKKFNWGYWDGYPELRIVQHSFLFTLYLLHRYGAKRRDNTFYENCFIKALPTVLEEVKPAYGTPEDEIRRCYTCRVLRRFAMFMGIAEVREKAERGEYDVRRLPLLDEVVRFHT